MAFNSGHALVVGVDTLANHSDCNVPIAGQDAGALASVLLDPDRCGYPAGQVSLVGIQGVVRGEQNGSRRTHFPMLEPIVKNNKIGRFFPYQGFNATGAVRIHGHGHPGKVSRQLQGLIPGFRCPQLRAHV